MPPKVKRQKQKRKPKIALVLGGGAAKAATYHMGVLLALEKHGFRVSGGLKNFQQNEIPNKHPISTVVGASAGAFVGAIASSGLNIHDLIRSFSSDDHPIPSFTYKDLFFVKQPHTPHITQQEEINWLQILKRISHQLLSKRSKLQGLFSSLGLTSYLRRYFLSSSNFKDLNCELYLVGSDVRENHGFIFGPKNYFQSMERVSFTSKVGIPEAVACSSAIPALYEPIRIDDHNHRWEVMDGEIFFACPFELAVAAGADLIIISHIYRPFEVSSHPSKIVKMDEIALLSLYSLIYNNFYNRLRTMKNTSAPYVVVLQPEPSDLEFFKVGHFSMLEQSISRGMRTGYHAALNALPTIEKYLTLLNQDKPANNRKGNGRASVSEN